MATKKNLNTTTKSTTKKDGMKKSNCNNDKVTTYDTINIDELSSSKPSKTCKEAKPTKEEKPIDMLIIHENKKPWSLPFTISVAVACILVFLAMITGFPTIMYTILSAGA